MKKWNQKEIKGLLKAAPVRVMHPRNYYNFLKRKMPKGNWDKEKILKLKHGTCPGGYIDKNGKAWCIMISTVYFKKFSLIYSTHEKDRHVGQELLISSFPLPRGPVIKHGR